MTEAGSSAKHKSNRGFGEMYRVSQVNSVKFKNVDVLVIFSCLLFKKVIDKKICAATASVRYISHGFYRRHIQDVSEGMHLFQEYPVMEFFFWYIL